MIEVSAALPPCPYAKRGRHRIALILPSSAKGWVTATCDACGTVVRYPVSGTLFPMDDATAVAEAERIVGGAG